MATKRLLVDAIHPEETRIVVTNGNRLEEFDFESATRKQLRGNIYLAKVTRVEPSLQAAFVEYGGNRHGFLAFSEIHPDYYQIPVADREALLRAEEEAEEAEEAEEEAKAQAEEAETPSEALDVAAESDAEPEAGTELEGEIESEDSEEAEDDTPDLSSPREMLAAVEDPSVEEPAPMPAEAGAEDDPQAIEPVIEAHGEDPVEGATDVTAEASEHSDDEDEHRNDASHIEEAPHSTEPVESIGGGGGDAHEETRRKPTISRRNNYKIQEVIKRRQVMLVQVVKEERGNKGAALTTYLSLAGRYSVLMPNTARGGGISRKITNAADRKRLKDIVGDLDIPPGQGIILRTAGASRTKAEVKRDFEYLQRLWENVRTLTLQSTAPCVVYEEGSLIKRTIRDLYNKDIDEVWVAGDDAYRESKDFMRMIMPSHAKNVQLYKDDQPIFSRYGVENQLDQMFSPQVTLPSGGYIVINPTEALVSIDVNSGRSTKEHNIEDTALQTNLEAADEVARQLRLRDLAGLIVIDFIDMVENRSNRAVERRLKDALKNDRARIQVGRISHFGLMEMSRQRIRFGVVESSTHKCPVCDGTGVVRSVESVALMVMRAVEDHVLRKPGQSINVKVPTDVALYILNTKRSTLNGIEAKYDLSITLVADDHVGGNHYAIERGEARVDRHAADPGTHVRVDSAAMAEEDALDEAAAAAEDEDEESSTEARKDDNGGNGDRQGRRRRRGRGRGREREERRDQQPQQQFAGSGDDDADTEAEPEGSQQQSQQVSGDRADGDGDSRRRRRRGRRGGRRNRRPDENVEAALGAHGDADAGTTEEDVSPAPAQPAVIEEVAAAVLAQEAIAESVDVVASEAAVTPVAEEAAPEETPKPRRARRVRKTETATEATVTPEGGEIAPEARPKSRRRAKAPAPTEAEATQSAEALNSLTTAEPIAEPEAAPAPAPASAPEAVVTQAEETRRPRKDLPEEGVIVTSTSNPETTEQKPKKGWWNRGFFGS